MAYFDELLSRYWSKGILLDSNLLLLFFVGIYDPRRILSFKRTKSRGFTTDDFDLLVSVLGSFTAVVTTPNILTEVNSLSNQLRRDEKRNYYSSFADGVGRLEEEHTPSVGICGLEHFKTFGLTDSGIINLAKGRFLVLTVDSALAAYLQNVGIDVINFNHLRGLDWGN
jgi:rRNA-processing protein FCF1